jgi:TonB family protein
MKHFFFLLLITISSSAFSQKIFNVYDGFTLELLDSVEVTTTKDNVISSTIGFGIYAVENAKKGTQLTFKRSGYQTYFFDCSNDEKEALTIILGPTNATLKSFRAELPYYRAKTSITHKQKPENETDSVINVSEEVAPAKDSILSFVDEPATFPGGQEELMKYLRDNIKYPQQAVELGVSGKVYMQFVIRVSGEVTNVKVVKSANLPMDAEAYRVVKAMPDWIPGSVKGKPVNCFFNLPVVFKLQ